MQPLVILDRDGVINQDSDHFIKTLDEWIPLAGSIEAMAQLYHAGWRLAVATNQSGIARGLLDEATLAAQHQKMQDLLQALGAKIELIVWCPHGPDEGCGCRKPKPGMLYQIAEQLQADLNQTWLVGDAARDLQAGVIAGCRTALVKTGKGLRTLEQNPDLCPDFVAEDLADFVQWLLNQPGAKA